MIGLPPLPGSLGTAFTVLGTPGTQGSSQGPSHRIEERGTLRQVLDRVASRYGVAWEFRAGTIRFLRTVSQTFVLRAFWVQRHPAVTA